ncbi:MAG TPA: tRNA (adenosine(37)-N6)-dimethylallyltransferase MiaA [Candidatus Limiplasma stercoravium]|nr:tRNA (adenosine(37)-N6)-dimethylallyltransferase MiaA [Candidatus Limiplasma stercoravium]
MLPKLIVVLGTNASGKSGLGVELALHYHGEIISADSRQVFRGLNLGSGKITAEEMRGVPHHLLDVRDAGDFFSMADFQRLAYAAIDGVLARGNAPFLVGGTGLYVDAVADGYVFSDTMPNLDYRRELETYDTETLYAMLKRIQPDTEVDPCNRNRVMRLLEKHRDGDDAEPGKQARYDVLRLGVTWPRDELRRRIDERLDKRLAQGMVDEVRELMQRGVSQEFLLKLGLEYRFITRYLTGEISSLEEMKRLLSIAIKQFAKRQMTWFRRNGSIHWLDMQGDPVGEACALIDAFMA